MRNWQLPNILHIFHPCLYLKELFFLALVHKILILSHISDVVWSDISYIYVYVYYVHLQPGCIHILIWNFFTLIPAVVRCVHYESRKNVTLFELPPFLRIPLTFQSSNNICNIQLFNISQLASISVPFLKGASSSLVFFLLQCIVVVLFP